VSIKPEFAILGAGAMGSIIGAHLARAGHSVLMLARGRRAEQIERSGLDIRGLREFSLKVPVLTDVSQLSHADVLIVATKALGTQAALANIRHVQVGAVFSIQNGVMKNDQLAAVWGKERVLGALADTSGELLPSGEVLFTRNEVLRIGELGGGDSARASGIAHAIDAAGVCARAVPDIESLEWSKFAAWVGMMVLAVATRAVTWKYLIDPDLALILVRLVREVAVLAAARGIPLSDRSPLPVETLISRTEAEAVAIVQTAGEQLKNRAPEHRLSTLQDLDAGRPLEIDETLGHAVREAARLNLSVPLLQNFYHLTAGIDRSRRR
jgi:2-dehydropantoate 2-reductase